MTDQFKAIYDSQDEIPETVTIEDARSLFVEKNGKWELSGIPGIKTQADVDRLNASLKAERDATKEVKEKLALWSDMDHEEVLAKLDRMAELEAAAEGKLDDAKIEELANKRAEAVVNSRTAPLDRKLKAAEKLIADLTQANEGYKADNLSRTVKTELQAAAVAAKVQDTALPDIMMYERAFEVREDDGAVVTREGAGITPGLDAKNWLAEMQATRPHWWPPSVGGGAGGSGKGGGGMGGKNPWSADNWNKTEQARVFKEKGQEYAETMARAAGSGVFAARPPKKKS